MSRPTLVLASGSPSRLRILRTAGIEPEVVVSGVDESDVRCERPEGIAQELATRKAWQVADRLAGDHRRLFVLGCDSVLELDGVAHGKPGDPATAVARWTRMAGRSGVLHTGHHLVDLAGGGEHSATAHTTVHFAPLGRDEIEAYVSTGEPLRVAGAFTIEGLGGAFVERIEGDPSNVAGLSLPLLRRLVSDAGVRWPELWSHRGRVTPPAAPAPGR